MAFIIHIQPLSSPLLLRNHPNTSALIPIPPMSLSSRNRSNSKAFCLILPCIAPVCEGMHYHKAGLPWQIKSTRILMFFPPKKPYFAAICRVMPLSKMYKVLLQCHVTLIFSTYLGISWQNKANRYTHS